MASNSLEIFSLDEKQTILEIPQIGRRRTATHATTHATMNILKKINLSCSLLLFALGVLLLVDTLLYNEEIKRIPSSCFDSGRCSFTMKTPSLKGQQMVYLGFTDFNQNYRDYISSVVVDQLYGEPVTKQEAAEDCDRFLTNQDMGNGVGFSGARLSSRALADPCGLVAYTFPDGKVDYFFICCFFDFAFFTDLSLIFSVFLSFLVDLEIEDNKGRRLDLSKLKTSSPYARAILRTASDPSKQWINIKENSNQIRQKTYFASLSDFSELKNQRVIDF